MTAFDQPPHLLTDPGWFPDPLEEHHLRYFDGEEWTDHVTHGGPEPCTGCHVEANAPTPWSAMVASVETKRPPVEPTVPSDINRRRPAPDRRRVRGREGPSRR